MSLLNQFSKHGLIQQINTCTGKSCFLLFEKNQLTLSGHKWFKVHWTQRFFFIQTRPYAMLKNICSLIHQWWLFISLNQSNGSILHLEGKILKYVNHLCFPEPHPSYKKAETAKNRFGHFQLYYFQGTKPRTVNYYNRIRFNHLLLKFSAYRNLLETKNVMVCLLWKMLYFHYCIYKQKNIIIY